VTLIDAGAGSAFVLALEELETHVHPQAARSLWRHISELPGQKIVTTHSPYFLPHVPHIDAIIAASAGLIAYAREWLCLSSADNYRGWSKQPARFLSEMGFVLPDQPAR